MEGRPCRETLFLNLSLCYAWFLPTISHREDVGCIYNELYGSFVFNVNMGRYKIFCWFSKTWILSFDGDPITTIL